jgi:putative transposase
MFEAELDEVLARSRYARRAKPASGDSGVTPAATGHRHGHRPRSLLGTFGKVEIAVPRARLNTSDGKTTEWKSGTLRAYQRRTLAADALIERHARFSKQCEHRQSRLRVDWRRIHSGR